MSRSAWGGLVIAIHLAACGSSATTLVHGPLFVTGDPTLPEARALTLDAAGRIVAVHAEVPTSGTQRTVELPGVLAVPGLHDAHIHVEGIGRLQDRVNLRGVRSPADIHRRISEWAAAHPDAAAVEGRGWDESLFDEPRLPTWRDLEGATDKPVLVRRVDGHAALASRSLLDLAGIGPDTPDPDGGRILRDDSGAPTGLFIDNAADQLRRKLPRPTEDDVARWLVLGSRACADAGLVGVHVMGMKASTWPILLRLDAAAELAPLRWFVYLDDAEDSYNLLEARPTSSPRVELRGVKLYADGALGSRGAALLEDYSDDPGHRGLLVTPPRDLVTRVARVHTLGYQAAIHAIGDRGNRLSLDAIAQAQTDDPIRRHRIEHAQVVHPDDLQRFFDLGVIASMQPSHATSDMRWAEARLGPDRLAGAYAWKTILDLQVPLAFGSDAPVESHHPILGLLAATTRANPDGHPPGGWRPHETLTAREALAAFSTGATWAVAREDTLGLLAPGHQADLTLFDRDPRATPADWKITRPVATMIDGQLRLIAAAP